MSFPFYMEIGVIIFFIVGLASRGEWISRWSFLALALILARWVARFIASSAEPAGHQPVSDFFGQDWVMQAPNIIAIIVLWAEVWLGSKAFRRNQTHAERRVTDRKQQQDKDKDR